MERRRSSREPVSCPKLRPTRSWGSSSAPPRREPIGTALAGLDAAAVCVAAARVRGGVAPVALDLPALAADRDKAAERPSALVGVLGPLLVVPRVELRIGQHLAE